jgi:hypothetical protein
MKALKRIDIGIGLVVVSAALGTACGDDDSQQRPAYSSGISTPTVTVSGLDDTQLKRVCESLDVYVDAEISFTSVAYIACLPPAIVLGGGTKAGCESQLSQCMSAFPAPIKIEAKFKDENVCFADLRACQATVSALDRCVNVNLGLAFDILDNWSCDGAGDEDLQRAAARAMDTASACAQIDASCQHFAGFDVD